MKIDTSGNKNGELFCVMRSRHLAPILSIRCEKNKIVRGTYDVTNRRNALEYARTESFFRKLKKKPQNRIKFCYDMFLLPTKLSK